MPAGHQQLSRGLDSPGEETLLKAVAAALRDAREIGVPHDQAERLAWVAYSAIINAGFGIK